MGMPGRRAGNQGTGVRKKGASPHLLSSALFIPITQC